MLKLVLSGGIASGKSSVCKLLREYVDGIVIFESDVAVHALIDSDAETIAEIVAQFGLESKNADGRISREFLRNFVFEDPSARLKLEALRAPCFLFGYSRRH